MAVQEGKIPSALGTVVTGAGIIMLKMKVAPMVAAGVVGFGLAHIKLPFLFHYYTTPIILLII